MFEKLSYKESISHLYRQIIKEHFSSFVIMTKNNKFILIVGDEIKEEEIQKKYQYLDYFNFVKDFQNNTGHNVLLITENCTVNHEEIRLVNSNMISKIPLLNLIVNNLENIVEIQPKYNSLLLLIKILSDEFLDFVSFHPEMKKYILDKESKMVLYKMFNDMLIVSKNNKIDFVNNVKECSKRLKLLFFILDIWIVLYYLKTDDNIIMCYMNKNNVFWIQNALEKLNWKIYF